MSERDDIKERIEWCLKDSACLQAEVKEAYGTAAEQIMQALDSWIEEQQSESDSFKVGDRVRLVQQLVIDGGSATEQECALDEEMEEIPAGDIGKVEIVGNEVSGSHVHVLFQSADDSWWFHPNDVEKV